MIDLDSVREKYGGELSLREFDIFDIPFEGHGSTGNSQRGRKHSEKGGKLT